MTKTDIIRDLKDATKGKMVISASKVAEVMGMRDAEARKLCEGCHYDPRGKNKMYYIEDVSTKIAERPRI